MSFLEWRRFNFFDLHENVDGGKVAEALQDTSIEVCTSGNSNLVIGDASGWIRLISRAWVVTSFKAYELSISLAVQLKHDPCLVTIGEDEVGVNPILKVWDCSRTDRQGKPLCVKVTRAVPSHMQPTHVTALAVHDNKNLMAVGFADGSVTLFRGDITRQRSSKMKTLANTGNTGITALAFKGATHLFVASRSSVMVFSIGSSGKERGMVMEEEVSGCKPNCGVMADQQFMVARNDAIYCYTTDGRGPCYALSGEKKRLDCFRSYLVTISKDSEASQPSNIQESSPTNHITILDVQNKFIVFSMPLEEVKAVITEWGAFYIITNDKKIHYLDEKDLQSKLTLLFKKNLYEVAIRIARSQKYDTEGLIDIYTQYGDHLYKKGDPKGAIELYVKTIGRLESSYVIRKYLDSRNLEPLTHYLQELHKKGLATEDHTTLLLTCFVKLDQHDQHGKLKEFINAKDRVIDFNVEIAIKVCRKVSVDDALHLSKKHKQHDWYLTIVTEDKKDYLEALNYIACLEFDDADEYMKKYGNILMQHVPAETTQFLKDICIDYKPRDKLLVDEEMMAGVISRNKVDRARPEEYIHLFLNNSERLVEFLEHLVKQESNWSTIVYNALIEHHLHVWSGLKDKPVLKDTYEQKVVRLLQNSEANYDKDQTLIVAQMLNFKPGILYLYEESKLYQQILRYHISQGDMDAAMSCCQKFGGQEPHLWVEMLWGPPPPHHLPEVLNVIANRRLLSPLLVIDCLPNAPDCTLGTVRKYLMDVLSSENEVMSRESALAEKYRGSAERGREALREAACKPVTCQASRCAACNRQLDLPARHFLCTHSYHQHCFQSFSESENECPACVPNNKKLQEVLQSQGASAHTTEAFHHQLEKAQDGFTIVAEYFGRGVFNKLTVITEDGASSEGRSPQSEMLPVQQLTGLPSLNVKLEPAAIKTDLVLNYGPGAEARMRLEEGNITKRIAPIDSQKSTTSKYIIPTPESRMRLFEASQRESQYSSSLEANLTRFTQPEPALKAHLGTTYMNTSSDFLDKDSSRNSTPKKGSPMSLRGKKTEKSLLFGRENTAGGSATNSPKNNTKKVSLNPFEDEETDYESPKKTVDIPYDESKDPFAEDNDEFSKTAKDDDYDKNLNPFE